MPAAYFPLTKEVMVIVLVAAFICRGIGFQKPPKQQVLNMVSGRKLMRFYDDDQSIRTNGELKWKNDLAYAREDLTRAGYMKYAERDVWELSDLGVTKIQEWAKKFVAAIIADAEERSRLLNRTKRFTPQLFDYLDRISKGEALARMPHEKEPS